MHRRFVGLFAVGGKRLRCPLMRHVDKGISIRNVCVIMIVDTKKTRD